MYFWEPCVFQVGCAKTAPPFESIGKNIHEAPTRRPDPSIQFIVSSAAALCDNWALTRRSQCAHTPFLPVGPHCAHDAPNVRPLCAHRAPTMCPLLAQTVSEFNRWARSAPTMRPLCAYYAPDMSINRFGVEPMGPSWPTMRPLCAHCYALGGC